MQMSAAEPQKRAVIAFLLAVLPTWGGAQEHEADPLSEASALQQLIRAERQQGDAEAAWNLEWRLMRLAFSHRDDVRSARILEEIGDSRVDILRRYDAGEFPPEIVLGCYYSATWALPQIAARLGSQPLYATQGDIYTCAAGSSRRARLALSRDALGLFIESARILVSRDEPESAEVQELLMKLLATSYRNSDYGAGRWSLELLQTYQERVSAPGIEKARTLALMGDWDLLFVRHLGNRYRDSALASYEEAIALLSELDAADEDFDAIFRPQTPTLLPSFRANRLVSPQTADSKGHVDIAFEIREDGKSARIRVLDSSVNSSRSVERDLVGAIKHGLFRPMAADGQLVESAPVTLRYYIND